MYDPWFTVLRMENTVHIYGLYDPRNPTVIKYVGQTDNIERRLVSHAARIKGNSNREQWIASMRKDGILPCLTILQTVPQADAASAEIAWIKSFPAKQLTNQRNATFVDRFKEPSTAKPSPLNQALDTKAKDLIISTLIANRWKIAPASKALGISRPTLYDRLTKLGIVKYHSRPSVQS